MDEQHGKGSTISTSRDADTPRPQHKGSPYTGRADNLDNLTRGSRDTNGNIVERFANYDYTDDKEFKEGLRNDETANDYLRKLLILLKRGQNELEYELWSTLLRYFEQNPQYVDRVKEILEINHKPKSIGELISQSLTNANNKKLQILFPEIIKLYEFWVEFDNKICTFYNIRYQQATYLYHGTTTKELDSILKFFIIGLGGGKFDFSSLTISKIISHNYSIRSSNSVIIKFEKRIIDKYLIHQGYTSIPIKNTGKELSECPKYIESLYDEEHRFPCGIINFINIRPTIIFLDINDENDRKHLKAKYGSLGVFEFATKEEFLNVGQ